MPRLEEWSVVSTEDPYKAPEQRQMKLSGKVYDDDRFFDGDMITTSRIVDSVGRTVTTRSGTKYTLGEPSADYLAWLAATGLTLDPLMPITIVAL
jgi:hypothetical protein